MRRSFHAVAQKLEKQGEFVSAKRVQSNGMRLRTKLKEFSATVKWLVALDRHEFVERAVVRALHGGRPRAHKTILKKSGEKTQNEDQRKEKWQEHWAEVFQGSIIECHRYRSA